MTNKLKKHGMNGLTAPCAPCTSRCSAACRSLGSVRRYEGDGQLAHLARTGAVDYVLTVDSDLFIHRCPNVVLIPGSKAPQRLCFSTGESVYHIPVAEIEKKVKANARKLKLDQLTGRNDLRTWLAGCIAKHGLKVLRTLAVVIGCDYSGNGFPGVGPAKALPAVYAEGCDVAAVTRRLWAEHKPRPKRGTDAAAAPTLQSLLSLFENAVKCFDHALAYDIAKKEVVELSGDLDAGALAALAPLVGQVPAPDIAQKIALGIVSPRTHEDLSGVDGMDTLFHDGELHAVTITAEMVPGAQLLPRSFVGAWDNLSATWQQQSAGKLGFNEGNWAKRFEKKTSSAPKAWQDLNEAQQAAATELGFDDYNWPPREKVQQHSASELQRWLKCRDEPYGSSKKAELVTAVEGLIELEAQVAAREGPECVRIISPEGDSWLELMRAQSRLNARLGDKRYAREDLKDMPRDGWTSDLATICTKSCIVTEALAFGGWNDDPLSGGLQSREVTQAFMRVSNCRRITNFLWQSDVTGKEFFRFDCPASMRKEEYRCGLCLQTKPGEEGQSVATAERVLSWDCECQAGNDACVHVRTCALLVAGLLRPESAGAPAPSTYVQNAWKRPAQGVAYNIRTPFGELPFICSAPQKAQDREAKGKKKGRRAVCLPVAANGLWDPQQEGEQYPAYDDPANARMRRALWDSARQDNGGRVCAAEALYHGRQPEMQEAEADLEEEPRTPASSSGSSASIGSSPTESRANRGQGRKRCYTDDDGVLLVLHCLRKGVFPEKEAGSFGYCKDVAPRVFRSYVRALAEMLRREFPRPTQEEIFDSTPLDFIEKSGRNSIELILDATGFQIGHPSNPEVARHMWSEYYHQYAAVYQIGIVPAGCGVFVSRGQSPKLTDAEQAMMGGALEFVHRGGAMQVDKGYDKLRTFAAKHGIDVVIPVKKRRKVAGAQDKSRKKFARESVRGDRKTARTRIHSEREMIRVKNYKLLTQMLPMEYKDILDDLIWLCVCLGNLDVGLTSKDYEETVASKRRKSAASA